MKGRALKLIKNVGIILAIGFAYYIFYRLTGIGIKCPLNRITGLLCPGCGISRMFLALLSLDLEAAFYYNAAALISLLPLLTVAAAYGAQYIGRGTARLCIWQRVVLVSCVALLAVFGILRNLYHIGLHPSDNHDYIENIGAFFWRYL